ncbi:MAG: uroporphyrinogen-III C-methyltransferase [Planctomycetota bacterium]
MKQLPEKSSGKVCLVGAGPGAPGLMTVTGLARLRAADAVVFDALANPVLLAEAPAAARRIDVGKRARHHKLTQDETNQLLLDLSREGLSVVRLKGGDPYLFGRGAEECAFLARHGVACEVVPGVTAGLAAPAAAGIPVTHRKVASTVTIVTGHEDPTKGETSVDYDGLAKLIGRGGTACFYMGVGRLQQIADSLVGCGLAVSTPAAVVQWGTLPTQRTAKGTLADIRAAVEREGVASPAIIVVGDVAAINEPGLDYFTARPLFGQRVLITRTRQQASDLRAGLEARGAAVTEAHTLELEPPADWSEVDRVLSEVSGYDWLLLTSVNAVATVADRLERLGVDARTLSGVRLAVVGESTRAALWERLRVRPDFVPTEFSGSSLGEQLVAAQAMSGRRCLLLRADIARPRLPEVLREAGAEVDDLTVYRTRRPAALSEDVLEAIRGGVDWVTFTSSSTVRNLMELLGEERRRLEGVRVASIGPVTSATVRELGLTVAVEAETAGVESLLAAVVGAVRGRGLATGTEG